jgi:tripartite-type tricarboxylate transporter receptor subunit TctC
MRTIGHLLVAILAITIAIARPGAACAENFPSAPVKIVVSVGAGAAPDVITRLIAEPLARLWGQPVIIENKPGGAGAVAIKAVAPAAPDGHTLYMALATNFIALPELQTNFPLDVLHDLVPIGFVGEQPIMIAAAPSLGVSTLPELIALLKRRPGEINVACGNRGSILHLTGEWLRSGTGTKFTLVHYNGGAAAIPDVLGGRIQVTIDAIASMRPPLDSGQVKPLAETAKKRLENFPNVPAAAETLPGFEAMGWMALMGPRGTPEPVADKISADLRTVLAIPELKNRLIELGNYIRLMTPAELRAYIVEQQQIWRPAIMEAAKAIK